MVTKRCFYVVILGMSLAGCSLFNQGGDEQYDPLDYPQPPQNAPFNLTLDFEKSLQNDFPVVILRLTITNRTDDYLSLGTGARPIPGTSETENLFQFVITKTDGTVIWKRVTSKTALAIEHPLIITPNGERVFQHTWELVDNDGDPIFPGNYLLFGGLNGLVQYADTTQVESPVRNYGNVGVGSDATELRIRENI